MKCPKCQSEMEEGFIADTFGHVGEVINKQEWGDGSKSWAGLLKTKKKVTTFCCTGCGYLESYAKSE